MGMVEDAMKQDKPAVLQKNEVTLCPAEIRGDLMHREI
jgi:hypothetical protein